jgi:hypothetical protein
MVVVVQSSFWFVRNQRRERKDNLERGILVLSAAIFEEIHHTSLI